MNLEALIRRFQTAASRGYTVAASSKYAKLLGGDGSETTAKQLLALALEARDAGGIPEPKEAPEETVEEPEAPEETVEEPEAPEAEEPAPQADEAVEGGVEEFVEVSPPKEESEAPADEAKDDDAPADAPADGEASDEEPAEEGKALEDMSRAELHDLAQEVDLKGRSKMGKDELLAALKNLET